MRTKAGRKPSSFHGLRAVAVIFATLAVSDLGDPARAATLYWDTDGATSGNSASSGAGLGGSGTWSAVDTNWWSTASGALQVWTGSSDAVFWGTAGAVTASTISASNLIFKTTGYSVNSGTLNLIGAASVTVDAGVTATVASEIAGTNTMWKLGAGTLILSNTNNLNTANTAAGGWRIEGSGTLRLMGDGSLGVPLPDTARNTITDIQFNQSTIQAGASFAVSQNRRTKINTNASTNRGDARIDVNGNVAPRGSAAPEFVRAYFNSAEAGPTAFFPEPSPIPLPSSSAPGRHFDSIAGRTNRFLTSSPARGMSRSPILPTSSSGSCPTTLIRAAQRSVRAFS
jgi:hypothetical protein